MVKLMTKDETLKNLKVKSEPFERLRVKFQVFYDLRANVKQGTNEGSSKLLPERRRRDWAGMRNVSRKLVSRFERSNGERRNVRRRGVTIGTTSTDRGVGYSCATTRNNEEGSSFVQNEDVAYRYLKKHKVGRFVNLSRQNEAQQCFLWKGKITPYYENEEDEGKEQRWGLDNHQRSKRKVNSGEMRAEKEGFRAEIRADGGWRAEMSVEMDGFGVLKLGLQGLMTKVAKSDMGDQAVLELKTCIRMITWAEVLCQTNTWGRALLRLKACRVPISIWAIAAGPAAVICGMKSNVDRRIERGGRIRLYNMVGICEYELPTSQTLGGIVFGDGQSFEEVPLNIEHVVDDASY
ncbi:hypothetical protein Tco_0548309 [Tanacetum coccineum]